MEKLKMMSPNFADENYKKLASLFPEAVTESVDENGNVVRTIDKEVLTREINANVVEKKQERYQFIWPGKNAAAMLANQPISKTLRFKRDKSVGKNGEQGGTDSENIYIEGDNLEVLKLLQETYLGKVKVIYIDPPYNTGHDFIYKDNYSESFSSYVKKSGQIDDQGNRLTQNLESNGRFHTNWLNMIYPRLKLARDLLSDDGVIFISIDDRESANLKKICDEIFSASNFIATFKWNRVKKAPSLSNSVRTKYEYVLAYYKQNNNKRKLFGKESYNKLGPLLHNNKQKLLTFPAESIEIKNDFPKGYYGGTYKVELLDDLINKDGLNENPVRMRACSAWGQDKINSYVSDGKTFKIKKDITTIYADVDNDFIAPSDIINDSECSVKTNTDASAELEQLGIPFDYPKPVSLIEYLVKMVTYNDKNAIVLDFFSGSATTAQAVMKLNSEDGGARKYILAQYPQIIDPDKAKNKKDKEESQETVEFLDSLNLPRNICSIGEERIRRAGKKIKDETNADIDYGFRCFVTDTSNMKDVFYSPSDVSQISLDDFTNNIKDDRTPEDLLIQVMLDLGIFLSSKVTSENLSGKKIYTVGDNHLIACFDSDVNDDIVTVIAKRHPDYAVFRDSSMSDDSVITNFDQIFKTYSPETVRKIL